MQDNPYKPPATNVDLPEQEGEVPEEIRKKIKAAWIAGCVTAGITVVFILIAMAGTSILGMNAWGFIDVAIFLALSYGVYKKSRTCAIFLLAFFVLEKILMWMQTGQPTGWIVAAIFTWFYIQGVIGTFQYHSWKQTEENASA